MKNTPITWIGGLILLLIIILLATGGGKKNNAEVILRIPLPESVVFVDEEERTRTTQENEEIKLKLSAGEHSVLVAGDILWPWTETLNVQGGENYVFDVFTLPQSASGFILTEEDSEYPTVLAEFEDYKLPEEQTALLSEDELLAVWVGTNGRQIVVEWQGEEENRPEYFCNERGCFDTATIFIGVSPVKSVSFLPERSDLILVAMEQGIFALEVDPTPVQNFQLLDSGADPYHLIYRGQVYSLDSGVLKLLNT